MENANSKCEYERLGRHFFRPYILKKDIWSTLTDSVIIFLRLLTTMFSKGED